MSVQRPGPDTSQDDDPTSIVRVLDEYKITRRQSMKRRERSPIAQQIHFEDSIFGGAPPSSSSSINDSPSFSPSHSSTRRLPAHWSKIPKLTALGPDPLENISVLQPQTQHSFSNASNILQEANESQDKIEKNKLHMNLVEKERQFLEAQNNLQKMEAKLQKMELMLKKERMEREAAEEKMRMKLRRVEDEKNNFEEEVGILRKREKNRKDLVVTESVGRRESKNNLEDVNRALLEQNQDLQNQVRGYEQETEEHRHFYTEEANHLRYQIQQLQSHVAEAQAQSCRDGNAAKENSELKQKLEEADTNLQRSQQEVAKLKNDIAQNEDAEILRRAMKDKLARYPNLVKENESLKMENNLLNETMENTELLKKQINELKEDLERAQKVARDVLKAQSDVVEERRRVRRWEGVCLGILSTEEKASLGDNLGPEAFEQKMAMMQRNELVLKGELENLKSTIAASERKTQDLESSSSKLEKELLSLKNDRAEQSKLIKKFQRKLLLVTKERDSFKGVLESYEHELTFTGGQFEKDRTDALQKIISDHKDMIDKLESQIESSLRTTASGRETESSSTAEEVTKLKVSLDRMNKAYEEMEEKRDALQAEMDRRALRGDYNPNETRILHFRNNPNAEAIGQREEDFKNLQTENEALKTRVKLLEEGQTKDLTILVGQKVEEGASSAEVQELKEQLRAAEVRKQRLIEAFKKTSQDFREVCYTLTGFRIDGLANDQYRLSPVYAESQTDYLLFQRSRNGECLMLETPFSQTLTDMIDLHLTQQRSIPVFLAAIITDLFSRQTFDSVSMSDAAGEDDDPICIE